VCFSVYFSFKYVRFGIHKRPSLLELIRLSFAGRNNNNGSNNDAQGKSKLPQEN